MREKRRQFTAEYKLEAVRMANHSGKPISQVARDLGIRADMLRTWRRRAESRAGLRPGDVFPGNGKLSTQEEEIRALRREVEVLKQEREILKKATAFFAREVR
ncbi:hypothetical protein BH23GEM3_BH23GEM3_12440 [soil metagenome]